MDARGRGSPRPGERDMNALHGIFPALTTPFVHGWVATDRWRDALERYRDKVGSFSCH